MQDLWVFVEAAPDTVTAEFAHDAEAFVFGKLLDGMADVAEGCAGADAADTSPHGFVGDVHQALGEDAGLSDEKGAVGVAVPAVFDDSDVDIDDVAVFQGLVGRDAVADDVVDRDAGGSGKRWAAIVEAGRDGVLLVDHVIVAAAVKFGSSDTGDDVRLDHVEDIGGKASRDAHFC